MSSIPSDKRPAPEPTDIPPIKRAKPEVEEPDTRVTSAVSTVFAMKDGPAGLIMGFVGDPTATEPVSEAFQEHTEASYSDFLKTYKEEPLFEKYVPRADPNLSPKEQVQQIYQAVMDATTALGFQPRRVELNRAPLSLLPLVTKIRDVKDKALIRFFLPVLRLIPLANRPQINVGLSRADEAKLIRNWMGENQEVLSTITNLNLINRYLRVLPEEIGLFTGLQSLELTLTGLTQLPDSIGNLTALTSLYLGMNQLTGLPYSFRHLTALTMLDLQHNRLTQLPNFFGNLANTLINLYHNRIIEIPDTFIRLTGLAMFLYRRNSPAEDDHQDYYAKTGKLPYCHQKIDRFS